MALHAIEGPVAGQIFFVGAGVPWSHRWVKFDGKILLETLGNLRNLRVKTMVSYGFSLSTE